MVFLGEGNLPGSPKVFSALLRAQTYRKGAQRGQTEDPISLLSLESVLAAGERKKHKSQKDATGQKISCRIRLHGKP